MLWCWRNWTASVKAGDGAPGVVHDISGELAAYGAGGGGSYYNTSGYRGYGGSNIGGDGGESNTGGGAIGGSSARHGTGSGGGGGQSTENLIMVVMVVMEL